ncbi:MAG TPA: trigger factor [Saprospiraceae bacterium]|nr:trigger factor [Saprospiraceae bacterium]
MIIDRSEIGEMISKFTVTLEPSDYRDAFKANINKMKGKANLKGFRAGKTPDHVIMKMYGENVLAEVLDRMFSEKLFSYLAENKIPFICQPLPAQESEHISLRPSDKEATYTYSYEVGTRNELEIQGINPEDSYTYYEITANENAVDDRIAELENAYGAMEVVDSPIEANDKVNVSAIELDENNAPKKDGWQSAFELPIFSIKEEHQADFIGKAKGDKIVVNLFELTFRDANTVRKDFLEVEEDDAREIGQVFELTVEEVLRKVPAKLDDDKIKDLFGQNGIETMEQLRDILSKNASGEMEQKSVGKLFDDIYTRITEETKLVYSDTFVKRWLREYENLADDKIEEMFEGFKKDLKWSIIQNELQERFKVKVTKQELDQYLMSKADNFMQQFGFFDQGIFDKVLKRMKDDQNEVYKASNIILSNKIFSEVEQIITKVPQQISLQAFEEMTAPQQVAEEVVSE